MFDHIHSQRLILGVIRTNISDHYPIFVTTQKKTRSKPKNSTTLKQRYMQNFPPTNFNLDLENLMLEFVNLQIALSHENFNSFFEQFLEAFKQILDRHDPIKKLSRRQLKLRQNPWITKGILISIRYKQICIKHIFSKELRSISISIKLMQTD